MVHFCISDIFYIENRIALSVHDFGSFSGFLAFSQRLIVFIPFHFSLCSGANSYGECGQGHNGDIADNPNEMGNVLDVIEMGSDFEYNDIRMGAGFTCISSTKGTLRCFGRNDKGQLGLGHMNNIGDGASEMGDYLADTNLGTGFNISKTDLPTGHGASHTCLVDDNLDVKSFGSNDYGQCGNNDETGNAIGDESNEMGDNLDVLDLERDPTTLPTTDPTASPSSDPTSSPSKEPTDSPTADPSADPTVSPTEDPTPAPTSINEPHMSVNEKSSCSVWRDEVKCWGDRHVVDPTYSGSALSPQYWYRPPIDALDLGDDFHPEEVSCGYGHQCSLSKNATVRCWGDNSYGQCGYGNGKYFSDSDNYGKDINVGNDVDIEDVGCGADFTCVLTADSEVKCFGHNDYGQLGYSDTDDQGDTVSDMGDDLDPVDLGTFTPTQIAVGGSHSCALSDGGDVKCWGRNDQGQLGYEDTATRGHQSGTMGNDLPVVNLGSSFTVSEVFVGAQHSCAVSDARELKCWGMSVFTILPFVVQKFVRMPATL